MQGSSGGPTNPSRQGAPAQHTSSTLEADDPFGLFSDVQPLQLRAAPSSGSSAKPVHIIAGQHHMPGAPGSRASSLSQPYEDALSHGILTPDSVRSGSLLDLDTPPGYASPMQEEPPHAQHMQLPGARSSSAAAASANGSQQQQQLPPGFSPAPLSWGTPSPLGHAFGTAFAQSDALQQQQQHGHLSASSNAADAVYEDLSPAQQQRQDSAVLSFNDSDASASELSSLGDDGGLDWRESMDYRDEPQELGLEAQGTGLEGAQLGARVDAEEPPSTAGDTPHALPQAQESLSASADEAGRQEDTMSDAAGALSEPSSSSGPPFLQEHQSQEGQGLGTQLSFRDLISSGSMRAAPQELQQRSNIDTGRGSLSEYDTSGSYAATAPQRTLLQSGSADLVDEWNEQAAAGGQPAYVMEDLASQEGASDLSLSDLGDEEHAEVMPEQGDKKHAADISRATGHDAVALPEQPAEPLGSEEPAAGMAQPDVSSVCAGAPMPSKMTAEWDAAEQDTAHSSAEELSIAESSDASVLAPANDEAAQDGGAMGSRSPAPGQAMLQASRWPQGELSMADLPAVATPEDGAPEGDALSQAEALERALVTGRKRSSNDTLHNDKRTCTCLIEQPKTCRFNKHDVCACAGNGSADAEAAGSPLDNLRYPLRLLSTSESTPCSVFAMWSVYACHT